MSDSSKNYLLDYLPALGSEPSRLPKHRCWSRGCYICNTSESAKYALRRADATPYSQLASAKLAIPQENILWAVELQFFTRYSIDFILNFADECTGYGRKIGAFWDILPDKFVGIFNSTLLPRRKWICEKHYIRVWSSLKSQGLWNHLMAAEFRAIVCCNCAHCVPVRKK